MSDYGRYESLSGDREEIQDVEGILLDEEDIRYPLYATAVNLGRREIQMMNTQKDILLQHIESMKKRVDILEELSGTQQSSKESSKLDSLNTEIETTYEQVNAMNRH